MQGKQTFDSELTRLLSEAPVLPMTKGDRFVVLSDLHMGDGGPNDDFKKNADVTIQALRGYYLPRNYTLILNGDIEEYLRCRPEAIRRAWKPIFEIFETFRERGKLHRLVGNHELRSGIEPFLEKERPFDSESIKLDYNGKTLFLFHGHQAGKMNSGKYNGLIGWSLRVFANTLRIGNLSIAHDSEKKIELEKTVYDFSKRNDVLSIIGHTHRPLFESLSKQETYNFHIERLCRLYAKASEDRREKIRQTIQGYKAEYLRKPRAQERHLSDSIYGDILVPCLFNSGCAVGKRGITALEIKRGKIFLVFWSDRTRTHRYREYNEYKPATMLGDTYRFILRRERLDYIFSRISLLR